MRVQPFLSPEPASFVFTDDNLQKAQALIARYPSGKQAGAAMPLLDLAQRQTGWVSRAAIEYIAGLLNMPPMRVYEVATFYTMYRLHPVGQNYVQVCTNLPCWLRGSEDLLRACRDVLGVSAGETTADNRFTVEEVECAGACVNAPVVQIGDDYFEDLDHESMKALLKALQRGEQPKPGSRTGRQCSCPAGGQTTLKAVPVKGEA